MPNAYDLLGLPTPKREAPRGGVSPSVAAQLEPEPTFDRADAIARRDYVRQKHGLAPGAPMPRDLTVDEILAITQRPQQRLVPGASPAMDITGKRGGTFMRPVEAEQGQEAAQRGAAAFGLRTAPGLIPNPLLSGPASAAGEAAAQYVEGGEISSPASVAAAAAIPPALASATRLVRAGGRTLTRIVPSLFGRAQGQVREAGEAMVEGLRPTGNAAQLYRVARAMGDDLIPATHIQRILADIQIPATPANPRLEAVRTTMDNLQAMLKPGGAIQLADLETIRRDIGPLLRSQGTPSELRGLYGAIVKDLETAAGAGGVGASFAREAATMFKQESGAAKVAELIEKATSRRVISGADVPALNVGTLMKLTREPKTRKKLTDELGSDGLRVIDEFVRRFRSLPPDVAYNGWGRMLITLGGGAGGGAGFMQSGDVLVGAGAAIAGGLTPEVLTNMAMVGANPQHLNRLMVSVAQGLRAVGQAQQPRGAE